ncbi:MAG: lysozyme inhibitor LprI family protein [Pseudomonadota bacterium]
MIHTRFGIALVCASLAPPAVAQAACPGTTQIELNACAQAEYQAADAELNAAWRVTKPFFDGLGLGANLLDAQRKWLAFRDAECATEAALYSGGSIQGMIYSTCLTRLTKARSADLRALGSQ